MFQFPFGRDHKETFVDALQFTEGQSVVLTLQLRFDHAGATNKPAPARPNVFSSALS